MNGAARAAVLHPTVFVAPGAVVLGDVTLKARASVWFNTVVRGDSAAVVVGEDTNLQDNSVVHEDEGLPTMIGDRVTVGHRTVVHGCVIEDDCLIGMGSVILSGARIGTGSLIGASTLVREHQSIPAGSLVVGSPARVVGPASDEHRAAIRNGASHYAELARFYMMRGLARGADARGQVVGSDPPMTDREWQSLIFTLGEEPSPWTILAETDPTKPNEPDDPLLHEALSHNLALDQDRRRLIEDALNETELFTMAAEPTKGRSLPAKVHRVLNEWLKARRALGDLLESLSSRHWCRPIGHPTRGARTLAAWVREWADEDAERRRVLERARK